MRREEIIYNIFIEKTKPNDYRLVYIDNSNFHLKDNQKQNREVKLTSNKCFVHAEH